jgi:hypothetical protein
VSAPHRPPEATRCFVAPLLGAIGSDGVQDDFLGVPMFFSGFDGDTNRHLVSDAGFTIILDEVVTMQEPEGPATFLWIMAQALPSR